MRSFGSRILAAAAAMLAVGSADASLRVSNVADNIGAIATDLRRMVGQRPPPQPRRSNSPACAHSFPRHSTNSQNHFPFKSGAGPRECARRRGDLAWLSA